jgi:hypothetical protein
VLSLSKRKGQEMTMPIKEACKAALKRALIATKPQVSVDEKGYVCEVRDNLIEGVTLEDFKVDLLQGGGNELREKFRAAHSSSALAVNSFAPFKADPSTLWLPGGGRFSSLHFEKQCPHGVAGDRAPPNLDVVADGPLGVVAIESKLVEYLEPHQAEFSPAYDRDVQDWRRYGAWFKEMKSLQNDPAQYRFLDAAQLVKHAFGVARTSSGQRAVLLYLFWEPSNRRDFAIFDEHQSEIMRFADAVRGAEPAFMAIPYSELWRA